MPLGQGYSIEEQVTGQAHRGGIQIDVFPLLDESVTFRIEQEEPTKQENLFYTRRGGLCLFKPPEKLNIAVGSQIIMTVWVFSPCIRVPRYNFFWLAVE